MTNVNVRRSIMELLEDYTNGNTDPLDNLIRAWKGIQELPADDGKSFFTLGGYHGEPFQYRTPQPTYLYWGGWCNHGNILFPTWHRVYLYKLEQALQSIVPGVTLPYWDETSSDSMNAGLPWIFTQQKYTLDGVEIDNPLYSFTFPVGVTDMIDEPTAGDDLNTYTKPAGYQTVRYPLSGLVGTKAALAQTEAHNAQYPDPVTNAGLLNSNIKAWLHGAQDSSTPSAGGGPGPSPTDPNPPYDGIQWMFQNCLDAPNYTVFSNTSSAGQWNTDNPKGLVVPLEQPHNDIHLSVGGFDIPGPYGGESGQVAGSNGDMGENNTAGLDPIFFFHHCNVDRMFWVWQKKNGFTDSLGEILGPLPNGDHYPGTNSSDAQGPTPDYDPNTQLDLTSALWPFYVDGENPFTSNDAVNIENQLGYTYTIGSLDTTGAIAQTEALAPSAVLTDSKLAVTGIDRSLFAGSFVVRAYAAKTGENGAEEYQYLGHHSVLNRQSSVNCANCLNHLEVKAHFPLVNVPAEDRDKVNYKIAIQHRGRPAIATAESLAAEPSAALPEGFNYEAKVLK